jgi:hypothetical protein
VGFTFRTEILEDSIDKLLCCEFTEEAVVFVMLDLDVSREAQ